LKNGRLELFRNFRTNTGNRWRPRTLLSDSAQLDPVDALDTNFRIWPGLKSDGFRQEIMIVMQAARSPVIRFGFGFVLQEKS